LNGCFRGKIKEKTTLCNNRIACYVIYGNNIA
jgi:hypothetical protein